MGTGAIGRFGRRVASLTLLCLLAVVSALVLLLEPADALGLRPLLVVVAHPDDEALIAAGAIANARAVGRRVYVAVVTNGDAVVSGTETNYCGAAAGTPATTAKMGLTREKESMAGMGVLGLNWTTDLSTTDLFFLGYPNLQLASIAAGRGSDNTGLGHTYGEDGDGLTSTCNGDFRYLLSGRHSALTATDLKGDLDRLLAITRPADVYTLSEIDSHLDHATVSKQVWDAVRRSGLSPSPTIHAALIWPEGARSLGCTIGEWPNPSLASVGNDPYARFAPSLSLAPPPSPRCAGATATNWGSWGTPDEVDPTPAAMQQPTEATNLKWQVISKYASQIRCGSGGNETCGMMRAWVKKEELFWRARFVVPRARALRAGSSYLSDLAWTSTTNGWGPVERDLSNGEQGHGDGQPLTLNGQAYAKGLGAHAASDVRYPISNCRRFRASIGVDDEVVNFNGSIVFQVYLDGVKAYDSGLMTGASATKDIDLDTTGKSQLRLVITNGGDNINHDHGDWALARLTCAGSPPPQSSKKVYAPDCSGRPHFKPRTIIIACGDGNLSLLRLRWSRWTGKLATGVGVYHWNDCIPTCYRGHFHSRASARVKLYRVTRCRSKGFLQFTRMRVTPPASLPRFKAFTQKFSCTYR